MRQFSCTIPADELRRILLRMLDPTPDIRHIMHQSGNLLFFARGRTSGLATQPPLDELKPDATVRDDARNADYLGYAAASFSTVALTSARQQLTSLSFSRLPEGGWRADYNGPADKGCPYFTSVVPFAYDVDPENWFWFCTLRHNPDWRKLQQRSRAKRVYRLVATMLGNLRAEMAKPGGVAPMKIYGRVMTAPEMEALLAALLAKRPAYLDRKPMGAAPGVA